MSGSFGSFLEDFGSPSDSCYAVSPDGRFRGGMGVGEDEVCPKYRVFEWLSFPVTLREPRCVAMCLVACRSEVRSGKKIVSLSRFGRISGGRYVHISSGPRCLKFRFGQTRGRVVEAVTFAYCLNIPFHFYLLKYVFISLYL